VRLLGAVSCRWRPAERRLSVCWAPADVAAGALDARGAGAPGRSGASAVRSRHGGIFATAASRIRDVVTRAAARQRGSAARRALRPPPLMPAFVLKISPLWATQWRLAGVPRAPSGSLSAG